MKLIHLALGACALSACAADDEEVTPSTTDVERRVRPFETDMLLQMDNNCDILTVDSHWTFAQPGQTAVVYTVTDLTSGGSYTASYPIDLYAIGHSADIVLLSSIAKGEHRFLLEASLLYFDNSVIYSDTFRTKFPCRR